MMRLLIVMGICLGVSVTTRADESDDTLRYYLSNAKLVVVGSIVTKPDALRDEAGVISHSCKFSIAQVLKGAGEIKGTTITVNIVRFESEAEDAHPLIAPLLTPSSRGRP